MAMCVNKTLIFYLASEKKKKARLENYRVES